MSDFNLLSAHKTEEIVAKSQFKLSRSSIAIFVLLFVVFAIATFLFIINIYYSTQLTDKGNTIISLQDKQNGYTDLINNLNSVNSRAAAKADITSKIVLTDEIIKNIDTATNSTATNYSINTADNSISVTGTTNGIGESVGFTENLKKLTQFRSVSLDQIVKTDQIYTYNISFQLNSEKVQP